MLKGAFNVSLSHMVTILVAPSDHGADANRRRGGGKSVCESLVEDLLISIQNPTGLVEGFFLRTFVSKDKMGVQNLSARGDFVPLDKVKGIVQAVSTAFTNTRGFQFNCVGV